MRTKIESQELSEPIKIDHQAVSNVYVGKHGHCCCGCTGTHTYASQHRVWATNNRGPVVMDDEVNDQKVIRTIDKMNKFLASGGKVEYGDVDDTFLSVKIGKSSYIAYFKMEEVTT